MSKCDLQIVFERDDRTYRGGDEVSGTVYVQVNQDVETNGIVLERFWQTHGRGNTATGPKERNVLFQGDLRAGQSLSYPFRFTAPDGPPTYHGRYLNVDHYVHVHVDIPWAIDPKLKEEYVLLPCTREYGNLPTLRGGRLTAKHALVGLGLPVGVAMILFSFFWLPCSIGCHAHACRGHARNGVKHCVHGHASVAMAPVLAEHHGGNTPFSNFRLSGSRLPTSRSRPDVAPVPPPEAHRRCWSAVGGPCHDWGEG